jgi:hypothetical protein
MNVRTLKNLLIACPLIRQKYHVVLEVEGVEYELDEIRYRDGKAIMRAIPKDKPKGAKFGGSLIFDDSE